jgi:hypothetical protein
LPDDWPNEKEIEDLTKYADSLEKNHPAHEIDLTFFQYRGIHYAISRCDDCKKILGVVPVPEGQYQLYSTAYNAFLKFDEKQKKKSANRKK